MSEALNLSIEGINILYPVPTPDGQVSFDYYVPSGNSKYQLTIYNNVGQLIHKGTGAVMPGLNRLTYSGNRLAGGIYRFHVQVGALVYKKDMLVQ